jgi:tetratricopeptide (TPR) repeat protein
MTTRALRGIAWLATALALGLWLATATASAQEEPYDDAAYQRLIAQALEEFQRSNWDEAEGLFAQAHRIHPNARTLRGVGIAAFEARRYVRALEYLRNALRSVSNPLTDDQRVEVSSAIERAERYVATLELTLEPPDADVRVNGEPLASTGAARTAQVDPGLVQVQASAPNHVSSARELRVAAGEHSRLVLRLVPDRAETTRADVADAAYAQTTAAPTRVDGGAADASASGSSSSTAPQFGAWKWVTLGVGGLALLGGGAAHVKRELTASDHNADGDCLQLEAGEKAPDHCHRYREQIGDAELWMAVGYTSGGLLIGLAVAMFALEGSSDASPQHAGGCELGLAAMQCALRF